MTNDADDAVPVVLLIACANVASPPARRASGMDPVESLPSG